MSLPENYGEVEYDDEGNIVAYEGIPIEQFQVPFLYRALPPHKRKVVQSIFYCYALDELDEHMKYVDKEIQVVSNNLIEKVRKPLPQSKDNFEGQPVTPEEMPKKRRSRKS